MYPSYGLPSQLSTQSLFDTNIGANIFIEQECRTIINYKRNFEKIYNFNCLFRGGGGGLFNPDFWENTILRYELAKNLRVVLNT